MNEKKLLEAYNEYSYSNFDNEPVDELELDEDGFLSLAISERREHEVQTFFDTKNERLVYYADGECIDSEPCDDITEWLADADVDDLLVGCEDALRMRYIPLEDRAEEILKGIKYAEVGCGFYWGKNYYVEAVDKDNNSKWYFVDDIEELNEK